jgi:hypothetical protein
MISRANATIARLFFSHLSGLPAIATATTISPNQSGLPCGLVATMAAAAIKYQNSRFASFNEPQGTAIATAATNAASSQTSAIISCSYQSMRGQTAATQVTNGTHKTGRRVIWATTQPMPTMMTSPSRC